MNSTNHHFIIEPHRGVGPICFGMHKDEVSRAFTYVYTSFFKSQENKVRADACDIVGLTIHYDDNSIVGYIEVSQAESAEVTLELFGVDITGISIRRAFELLKSHSPHYEKDTYGYDFPELGINLFNHDFEWGAEENHVECIGVSLPGYRDG